jgi:hypothetical protein
VAAGEPFAGFDGFKAGAVVTAHHVSCFETGVLFHDLRRQLISRRQSAEQQVLPLHSHLLQPGAASKDEWADATCAVGEHISLTAENSDLSRISSSSSSSSDSQQQRQQSQKRPCSDVASAVHDELAKQHKQAKHACQRMYQHAAAARALTPTRLRLSCIPGSSRRKPRKAVSMYDFGARTALDSSVEWQLQLQQRAAAPGIHMKGAGLQDDADSASEDALQRDGSWGSTQSSYGADQQPQQQQQQQQQQPKLAPEPSACPSLPSLTVAVNMLLQLAAAQASPAVAQLLRQQLLQQIRAMAAAARYAGEPLTVAAALHQVLPALKAAVVQACEEADAAPDAAAAAAAAAVWPAGANHSAASAVVEHTPHSTAAAPCSEHHSTGGLSCGSAAAAVEAALLEAACEVQLGSLCLQTSGLQAGAHLGECGQGTAVTAADGEQQQQQQLDLEQLLQDELAAALAEQQM